MDPGHTHVAPPHPDRLRPMTNPQAARLHVQLGAVLILVAMLTGLAVGPFQDVPLVLSAHLAATMSGTILLAVGAVQAHLDLSPGARRWLVFTLAGSGYLNWTATVLGALLGTHALTPIHGAGTAGAAAEALVGGLLAIMGVCTVVSASLVVKGAFGRVGVNSG
jgi:hypothetical protein